jgi:hypothetical protein
MSSDQLKTALRFAGATPFTVDPTKALPPESRSRETNVLAATLPDGTALVATFRVLDPEHALKPSFPRVTGLFVGAAGQGFDNWNAENARRLDDFPIAKYRKAQRKR